LLPASAGDTPRQASREKLDQPTGTKKPRDLVEARGQ
jgi:hypothetical protein